MSMSGGGSCSPRPGRSESLPSTSFSASCASSGSSTDSNTEFVQSPVSLLERLRTPPPSKLSRKRKVYVNTPPVGKRRSVQMGEYVSTQTLPGDAQI